MGPRRATQRAADSRTELEPTMKPTTNALTASVVTAIALASLSTASGPPIPVFVVIQNQAGVPRQVLGRGIQVVTDAYRPLGIGIAWIEPPAPASAIPTVHVTLLRRSAGRNGDHKMIGVDAPSDARGRMHVAHILYQHIDDDVVTAHALAYVLAHVIRGALSRATNGPATIIHADRRIARALTQGRPVFTPGEAEAIRGVAR
jgi:hypothetical protein